MTMNTIDTVKRIAPRARDTYLESIRDGGPLFAQHGITTPLRMAHFLAQALHETGGFTILRENMNYSAPRLIQIFGVGHHSAAVTASQASELAGHPEAIAERVYGLGNPRKAREPWQHSAGRWVSIPRQRRPADNGAQPPTGAWVTPAGSILKAARRW